MPKLLFARPPVDAVEERRIRKLAGARHAPADWIRRARMTLTKTVVDVGATSGSGVELSDGIHTDHGGRRLVRLTPEQAVVDQHRDGVLAVGQDTPPAAAGAADLHSHYGQRLGAVLATAPQVAVQPAAEALIDLDRTAERLPIRIDHRTPQWVSRLPPEAQVSWPRESRIHGGQLLHDPRTHRAP